jgi:hypothetical protein
VGHCTNMLEGGYRKNMLADIGNVAEAMKALCMEQRVKNFKVVNPNDLIGLSSQMEEEEVERLVGVSPVHLSGEGYAALAEAIINMVDSKRTVFEGGKREREEEDSGEQAFEILYSRNKEWIYNTVAGQGKWSKPRSFNSSRSGRRLEGNMSRSNYGGYEQVKCSPKTLPKQN